MSQQNRSIEAATIVIFGASGDLTRRKLSPRYTRWDARGICPGLFKSSVSLVQRLTDEAFRARLYEGVAEYARLTPGVCELWPVLPGASVSDRRL